ncbi:hypothetical protein BDF14DRAFT_1886225 [Spinellus fusiger]|nr:hypothetical protein BDF14DRAFT_1886225 [Spinellus fusiger]
MNILPHKSWHVYNRKNIEKVQKDEAKVKEEENAKAQRVQLAESEARLVLLRQRAEQRNNTGASAVTLAHTELQSLEELLKAPPANGQNEEYLAEQKEKDNQWDRQITMYLDKGKESVPWYSEQDSDKYTDHHVRRYKPKEGQDKKKFYRPALKTEEDPMALVKKHLKKRESSSHSPYSKHTRQRNEVCPRNDEKPKASSKESSIEALRAQRLAREQSERLRTRTLVYGEEPKEERRYNAQFNPKETAQAKERRKPLQR